MLFRIFRHVLLGAVCFCAFVALSQSLFAQTGANEKALVGLDDEWSKAATAKDLDRVVSFYADDAVVYPPNEPVAKGPEAARKIWASYFAMPDFRISWKTTTASVNGNLGYTAGTYEDSFKGPDGKTVAEKGKYLCVWRKGPDGKWKAIQDMWNTDTR